MIVLVLTQNRSSSRLLLTRSLDPSFLDLLAPDWTTYIFMRPPLTSQFPWLFCLSEGAMGPPEAGELTPRPGPSPEEDPAPRPSKRLTVLTQCVWTDETERSRVLKVLCQRMALNRLDRPFWVGRHLIRPAGRHVEGERDSGNCCINYKIHVSAPVSRKPARLLPTILQQVGKRTCRGPIKHWRRGRRDLCVCEPHKPLAVNNFMFWIVWILLSHYFFYKL